MEIYTIGVYNSTETEFFNKLVQNNIDTFCDIRQRRGVRGSKYAFVNSTYLQNKLRELDIKYEHILSLAPTTEIREKQWADDARNGEQKKTRNKLGEVFSSEYCKKILEPYDFDALVDTLDRIGARRVVFFCVEEHAVACHRSLVAKELNKRYNYPIKDL